MRVTETKLIQIAAEGLTKARDKIADVSEQASSGKRVRLPSQDVVAWSEGARALARNTMSTARGSVIARSRERLVEADTSLDGVGGALARGLELATQLANGVYSAENRKNATVEIAQLRASVLAMANTRSNSGEFLFAGHRSDVAPFDATGVYVGDTGPREVEVGEEEQQSVGVDGTLFTAAAGVDLFQTFAALESALATNQPDGVRATITSLQKAISQIGGARAVIGTKQNALDKAEDARSNLEFNLESTRSRTLDTDPIAAASDLARGKMALESAMAASEQIMNAISKL